MVEVAGTVTAQNRDISSVLMRPRTSCLSFGEYRMRLATLVGTAALAWSAMASSATAQVTTVGSQGAFNALGTVTQNTNWDAYPATVNLPGSPFTVGSLTFIEGGQNLIYGVGGYNMARNLFTDNYVRGTTVQVAGNFNMLAFNAGNFSGSSNTTFSITTNLGNYGFATALLGASNQAPLTFVGFEATGTGEYFTQFSWNDQAATGITDVQLGVSGMSTVPEPATYALMSFGLCMVGAVARRRRSASLSA